MRLVMMGTGPFAVPTFRRLCAGPHEVLALVTGPLRSPSGNRPAPPTPMRDVAVELGLPLMDPENVNTPAAQAQLAAWQADLLVVCDYGQILAAATLATARLGGINLHASLLPKYRGAAPINWALWHGETETGITVIHMTPQLDAGPCIAQACATIGPEETAAELEPRLAELGAGVVADVVTALAAGPMRALPQDPALASKARRLKKADGLIDWTRPAATVKNQIRALEPWPKNYTYWQRPGGAPLRLILGPVAVVDASPAAAPGTVLEAAGERLVIAAGTDAVRLDRVQPSGKRLLSIAEFLRGYPVQVGQHFGGENAG